MYERSVKRPIIKGIGRAGDHASSAVLLRGDVNRPEEHLARQRDEASNGGIGCTAA
ncbi:MAG: hypothetical protein ACI835_002154 [Planctomycetota bacterium]|jgi:hypothetical protein